MFILFHPMFMLYVVLLQRLIDIDWSQGSVHGGTSLPVLNLLQIFLNEPRVYTQLMMKSLLQVRQNTGTISQDFFVPLREEKSIMLLV